MNSDRMALRPQFVAGSVLLGGAGLGVALGVFGWKASLLLPLLLGGLVVLYHPVLGLLAVVFLIPFEGLSLFPGANTATKLSAALVAGAWLVAKLARRESWRRVLESRITWATGIFLAYCFASVLWSEVPEAARAALIELVRVVMLVGLGLLTMDLLRKWTETRWILRVLVAGGIVGALVTILQYLGGGISRAGEGISGGINTTAFVQVSLVPLAFALIRGERRLRWKLLGMGYVAVGCVSISMTFSRMSFLVLPLLLGLELWETLKNRKGRKEVLALFAVGTVAFFSLVPIEDLVERAETIGPYVEGTLNPRNRGLVDTSGRGFHIMVALSIFREHPVIGAGYQTYGNLFIEQYQFEVPGAGKLYQGGRSPHGLYWGFLSELGLVGITLWLALLLVGAWNLRKAWSEFSSDRTSQEFLIVRAVALLFFVQFLYGAYTEMHLEKIFWIVLGLTVVLRKLAENSHRVIDGSPGESAGVETEARAGTSGATVTARGT